MYLCIRGIHRSFAGDDVAATHFRICVVPRYVIEDKDKGKVHPRIVHESPEGEKRHSSTLSLTSALYGVGVQCYAPAALPPGKTRYLLYRRLGGPQSRSGEVRKISPPPGFDPRPS